VAQITQDNNTTVIRIGVKFHTYLEHSLQWILPAHYQDGEPNPDSSRAMVSSSILGFTLSPLECLQPIRR